MVWLVVISYSKESKDWKNWVERLERGKVEKRQGQKFAESMVFDVGNTKLTFRIWE
jgi:hypothetical protein